jgi:hypothetical protein
MHRPPRSWISLAVGVVVLMLGSGVAGWAIGHHRSNSSEFKVAPGTVYLTPSGGTAYLGANQSLNRQPRGIAYSLPPIMSWDDANGATNDGHPTCIPFYHAVRVKRMEAVIWPLPDGGGRSGTVLWVQC